MKKLLFLLPLLLAFTPSNSTKIKVDEIDKNGTALVNILPELQLENEATIKQLSTPANPSAGYNKIYPKADNFFYQLNSSGVESKLGGVAMTSVNDNRVTKTVGTSGDELEETDLVIDDSNNLSGINNITVNGTINSTLLTNDKVMVSTLGEVLESTVSTTELDFLLGTTSNVQTQINSKLTSPLTTNGDIYYYNLGNQRLPIGTLDQLLTVDASGIAIWKDAPVSTTLTAKGSLQSFSSVNIEFPVGTDGQIIVADSAEVIGLKYIDLPVSTTLNTKGDIQTFTSVNAKLPVGVDNEVLFSDSTTSTGLVWKDPTTVVFTVAQAEIIGSYLLRDNDCIFDRGSQPYGTPFAATSNCLATEIVGNVTQPDVTKPTIRVPNAKIGTYEVTYNGTFYNLSNAGSCYFSISTSSNYENQGANYSAATPENRVSNSITGTFDVTTEGDIDFNIITSRGGSATTCRVYGSTDLTGKFTVKYYPPKETIVRQNQIADALNTNGFDVKLNGVSGCVVTNDPLGILSGCVRNSNGNYTISYSIMLLDIPSVQVTAQKSGGIPWVTSAESSSTTSYTFTTRRSTTETAGDSPVIDIHIGKGLADYNKSLMVYGQFEQIKSGDLPYVTAEGNNGIGLGAGSTNIPFTTVDNPSNEWGGDELTSENGGNYLFTGLVRFTAGSGANIVLYVNEGGGYVAKHDLSSTTTSGFGKKFDGGIRLNAGDKIAFRSNTAATLTNNLQLHWLHIQKVPDIESLVKNLNDGSVIKCQKKELTSNCVGVTECTEISFSNLTIGNYYRLSGVILPTTGTVLNMNHDGNIVTYSQNSSGGTATIPVIMPWMKATTTTITADNTNATTLLAAGRSYVEICEKDASHVIETTEF